MIKAKFNKSNWKKVKFGDISKEVRISEHNPIENGLERYIGLERIDSEDLHIKSWGYIKDGTTFSRKFIKGQLLFGRRRAYLKKAAIADFDGICSGDILVFEAIKDKLIPELLPFIVQNEKFFNFAIDASAGSLSPRVKFKNLAEFELSLPNSLEEQKELADLLGAGDKLKVSQLHLIDELNNYKKALANDVNQESNGNNPIKWPEVKLGEVVSFLQKSNRRAGDALEIGKYPFFTSSQVQDKYFNEVDYIEEALILGTGGSASIHISQFFSCSADNFIIKSNTNKLLNKYIYEYLKGRISLIEKGFRGTGLKHLSKTYLKNIKIIIPPLEKQKTILNSLSKVDREMDQLLYTSKLIVKINKSLIKEIF